MTAAPVPGAGRSFGWRLALTVWLVYAVLATTNVVRETYLALAIGNRASVRVDEYQGLHPDLFEFAGRGWYINSNPGTSIVGALPYALFVRPAIALATRIKPEIAQPKPPATYDDPRPNRNWFMNQARARGLDVILGMAAVGTGITMMAPLGALAALLVFFWLRSRLGNDRRALLMALLFAFATPTLFRAAFINQNALVAHLVLVAWVLMTGVEPRPEGQLPGARALAGTGLVLGYALVVDFSAIPFLIVFGCWILTEAWQRGGFRRAVRDGLTYSGAAFASIAILFAYHWVAFGHPLWPAQRYMPATEYSVKGWLGFTMPTAELLVGNLFDPRYGLFAFCPLLLLAFAAPFLRARTGPLVSGAQMGWIFACFAGLLLFSSANQFGNLQWNTGVRYMVPAVPLLFVLAVPVLESMHRLARWSLVGVTLLISFAVSMMREDVPLALRMLVADGPTLPVLLVLQRMASGYDVPLPSGVFWLIAAVLVGLLLVIWRPVIRQARA